MTRDEIVNRIRVQLQDRQEVKVCLVFGSAAAGNLSPGSDLDIAVCGEEAFTHEYLVDLQLLLSKEFGREVDLLDMNRSDGLILSQVLTKGLKAINREPDLLAYHIMRMLLYNADMYPNYQMMQKAKVRRFAHGH